MTKKCISLGSIFEKYFIRDVSYILRYLSEEVHNRNELTSKRSSIENDTDYK